MSKIMYDANYLKNFFYNKKIFITGHTGFKGSWLAFLLKLIDLVDNVGVVGQIRSKVVFFLRKLVLGDSSVRIDSGLVKLLIILL